MELQIEVSRVLGYDEILRTMVFILLPYNPREHRHPNVSNSPTSQETLTKWYQDCLGNHAECRSLFDWPYIPHRLIDIGEPGHRWGGTQPLQLLMHNMAQLKEGISRQSLPRVFSDAIAICWQLGIRYLWIDSLCICQDSEEDWNRESGLMGIIYTQAIINIAATAAVNSDGSLFSSMGGNPSVGLISWGVVPGREYIVVENNLEWAKGFSHQPLLRRAWVMQERLLATRMIHFAGSELIWECRTLTATESYPVQVPSVLRSFHERRNRFWKTDFTEDDGAWSVLIQDYSKCELTFSKDKLVALSGLVSILNSRGLSRGRFFVGITWEMVRPSNQRAPSWSWASLDCPVW
ncbi:HET-domain-containing protein, partial [Lindgomyces ingoldianus]